MPYDIQPFTEDIVPLEPSATVSVQLPAMSPHRLKIALGHSLARSQVLSTQIPRGICCKLQAERSTGGRDMATEPEREESRTAAETVELDLKDAGDAFPGRACLPRVIMLFPGRTVLLPVPLAKLETGVAPAKLRQLFRWIEDQRDLARDRYSALWKIRGFPLFYDKVREMALKETRLLKQYRSGWDRLHDSGLLTFREQTDLELCYAQVLLSGICTLERLIEVTASVGPQRAAGMPLPSLGDISAHLEMACRELSSLEEDIAVVSRQRMRSLLPDM